MDSRIYCGWKVNGAPACVAPGALQVDEDLSLCRTHYAERRRRLREALARVEVEDRERSRRRGWTGSV